MMKEYLTKDRDLLHYSDIDKEWKQELEPLRFWPKHSKTLPHLAAIAAVILNVAASVATCERIFSSLKIIISPKRTRLEKQFAGSLVLSYCRAKDELEKKCQIYGNGCIKHGKNDEGKFYLRVVEALDVKQNI